MKPKDHFELLFRLYSLDHVGRVRLRRITGFALSRRKARRLSEWKKRHVE